MATAQIYFTYPDGRFSQATVSYPDGDPVPGPPAGATSITLAEYDALKAAFDAAAAAAAAIVQAQEEFEAKLAATPDFRTVASFQAPDRIKNASAYVCTGSDDQVQINKAIVDTMAEGGGTVILSAGDFNLSDVISIPAGGGLVLAGSSRESVLKIIPNSNRYAIRFPDSGAVKSEFRDFTIDGNLANQTSAGGGIWANGAVHCRFNGIRFTACFDEGLHVATGRDNVIEDCLFEAGIPSTGQGRGLHFLNSTGNRVSNCSFEALGGGSTTAGGIYDQSGEQLIENCNFITGRSGVPSIRVQDVNNTKITGCNFDGGGGTGVSVTGESHVISGNSFFDIGNTGAPGTVSGIHLDFSAKNCQVSGNTLATDPVNGATMSLIRENSDGGAGNNLIHGNVLVQRGTPSLTLLDLAGAGTVVRDNIGAGTASSEGAPLKLVAGAVSNGSFPAARPAVDGSMAVDTVNNRVYIRVNGVWKYAALT